MLTNAVSKSGVKIPNEDGSVDVAELWRKSNDAVKIPNEDGSVDVAELG